MAYTVATIIAEVQRRMPEVGSVAITAYVNQIHREIEAMIALARRDTFTINLTAGTREYDLLETTFQVGQVLYRADASTAVVLQATTVEMLSSQNTTWRHDANAVPDRYYLSSGTISTNKAVIGFYPTPPATTNTGYPIVEVFGSVASADLTSGDTVLTTLHSSQVYVEGASKLAALAYRPGMVQLFQATYNDEFAKAKKYVLTRSNDLRENPLPNVRD